jgi:hypothetical protein
MGPQAFRALFTDDGACAPRRGSGTQVNFFLTELLNNAPKALGY